MPETAACVRQIYCLVFRKSCQELFWKRLRPGGGGSIDYPDAGKRHFFLFLFRLRTVRTSKFSASRLWLRTDRCLMPWRFWHALCSGTGRHLLGLRNFWLRKTVCPKSWISGRKLRSSNCSPESQKKEKVSPPGVRLTYTFIYSA